MTEGKIIIYGAHLVALEVARWLSEEGRAADILGFAVTSMEGNPSRLEGLEVKEIDDYAKTGTDATILIAVPVKYHKEIETHVRALGFTRSHGIGLEELSQKKGQSFIKESEKKTDLGFALKESEYDTSWLDMDFGDVCCKFPTLFYKRKEEVWKAARSFGGSETYIEMAMMSQSVHTLLETPVDGENTPAKVMQIYMAFGEGEAERVKQMKLPGFVTPMQVGCKWAKHRYGTCFDDEGDSVSEHNRNLAEMTAAYAIWKHQKGVRYKGLCHYRRHFVLTERDVMKLEKNEIDVLLTTPRYVPYGIRNMFLAETPVKEPVFEMMLRAIKESHPGDLQEFEAYMERDYYFPNNMVVAKSEIYDRYCEWTFPILLRMLVLDEETGYGHGTDRHIAYAAELLTSFYFVKNRNNYRIAVTDYKFIL